jgi:hypothetical protein
MPYYIQLGVKLNDNLGLTHVTVDINTTDLPSDSKLVKEVAIALLKALKSNKDSVQVQDLLNELGIAREVTPM